MRFRAWAVLFSLTSAALAQSTARDNDTMGALLAEVRQLRQAIAAMTVASQRVQIALYALQMQDAAVTRATQRLDDIHARCAGADGNRRQMAMDVQRVESRLTSGTVPESEAKALQERLDELKAVVERQTADVQACQANEADASSQLRNDQAKLSDLQDRINQMDRSLEALSAPKP